ncbi:MAG: hypothetical protein HY292_03250 [Planctomycetes bacterium]|nr:hypothetical protein [Planctomycetota bacterium]
MRTTLPVPEGSGKSCRNGGTFIVRSLAAGDEIIDLGPVDEWTVSKMVEFAERCNRPRERRR